jgi:hypothetical protein
MAYKIVSVYKRPDPSVKWHIGMAFDQDLDNQLRVFCFKQHQGRHFRSSREVDSLTLEFTQIWSSKEAYEEVRYSPLMTRHMELVQEYFDKVGIIAEPQIKEELDLELG